MKELMPVKSSNRFPAVLILAAWALLMGAPRTLPAQVIPPGFGPRTAPPPPRAKPAKDKAKPEKTQAEPQQSPAAQAPAPQAQPGQAAPAQQEGAQTPAQETGDVPTVAIKPVPASTGLAFTFHNANLTQVIDIIARQLKINYILDPRVKGGVTINTYGEIKQMDLMALLQTILRINGAAVVQVGNLYRIVPIKDAARLPVEAQNAHEIADDDERMMLNLIFVKYATVGELSKLLEPFLGESATMIAYDPANLLLILDNSRNMRRTMGLIDMLDSDTLINQRVRLFDVKNGRPSQIAEELEKLFKGLSQSDKSSVRFVALDRINTIITISPNPGAFDQVEKWIRKLDVTVQVSAGSTNNYVYRVRYGRAEMLAASISQLYGTSGGYGGYGFGMGMGSMGMGRRGGGGRGLNGGMGGGMGYGGMGGGMGYGGMGYGGMGYGGMGGGMGYGGMGGGMGYGGLGYGVDPMNAVGAYGPRMTGFGGVAATGASTSGTGTTGAASTTAQGLTGSYLGAGGAYGVPAGPRVVPNFFDNSLLIQATPQEYEQLLSLLRQLDVPPRQVLIEAKIFEVSLTGAFAGGVTATLRQVGVPNPTGSGSGSSSGSTSDPFAGVSHKLQGDMGAGGIKLTAGMMVDATRELLVQVQLQADNRNAKLLSAPRVIATDSIPATINVGQDVPTLTSQAVSPVQSGGSSLFTNTVQNVNSGVTLDILAMVNPSGIVTMVINQEVSAPVAPAASAAIQSPSFTTRNVSTQVTVQDGDTVAIGGIIQESITNSTSGVPLLSRIPGAGMLFGAKSYSKERTELVVFLTPRVIYDTNQIVDATEEIKEKMRSIRKLMQE